MTAKGGVVGVEHNSVLAGDVAADFVAVVAVAVVEVEDEHQLTPLKHNCLQQRAARRLRALVRALSTRALGKALASRRRRFCQEKDAIQARKSRGASVH